MGIAVSNWRLARAVSLEGELGVVSGTALDTVLIRRLQNGDPGGHMRRALAALPIPGVAEAILRKWYQPEGRQPGEPYRLKQMPTVRMGRAELELVIAANFVEVFLAKEAHRGLVGINLLEKIQLPTLPSLLGAMLAGVDVVLMGGGIPLSIPGVLDAFSELRQAHLKVHLAEGSAGAVPPMELDPADFVPMARGGLKRPAFFAVVSSDVLAKTLLRKANGRVDGFVVEHFSAGGHNAPPRRNGEYGPKDLCAVDRVAELQQPFWLAGGCASPEALDDAIRRGAQGVQVGTAFACAEESGIDPAIKAEIIARYRRGELEVATDFHASPTGYPFKRVDLEANDAATETCRVCDLGYLRHVYAGTDGSIGYRCPAGPVDGYLRKGGTEAEAAGKRCLCNGLLATVGLGQTRDGVSVPPLLTWGDELAFLDTILPDGGGVYSAKDVLDYLRGGAPETLGFAGKRGAGHSEAAFE